MRREVSTKHFERRNSVCPRSEEAAARTKGHEEAVSCLAAAVVAVFHRGRRGEK